jgi:TolA-binding protein
VEAYESLLKEEAPATLLAHAALDLAQIRIAQGRHDQAAALLQKAREARLPSPESTAEPAEYLQGLCELKLDKPAKALATLEKFLSDHPKSTLATSARLVAGQAALKAGKNETAVVHLQSVVDSTPSDAVLEPALLCLGQAHAALQNWDKSRAAFESYLGKFEKAESWFQARFGIGWALENQGRQAEAITAYRDVVARHEGPTAARAQFQIGECFFALKKHDEAVRELLKVDILYAYPEWSAAALYEAGRCLIELKKPEEARRQFTAVTERFKDTQWAGLASRQLAQTRTEPTPGRDAR